MTWYYQRGDERILVHVTQVERVPGLFELAVTGGDGMDERAWFSDGEELLDRQGDIQHQLTGAGWSGPFVDAAAQNPAR
jgi:hypothetical protein